MFELNLQLRAIRLALEHASRSDCCLTEASRPAAIFSCCERGSLDTCSNRRRILPERTRFARENHDTSPLKVLAPRDHLITICERMITLKNQEVMGSGPNRRDHSLTTIFLPLSLTVAPHRAPSSLSASLRRLLHFVPALRVTALGCSADGLLKRKNTSAESLPLRLRS
jgi:hypothetical protein